MPYLRHQRQEDRRQHDDEHGAFHEGPGREDEEDDQHHDDVRVVGDAEHPGGDHLGDALEDDAVAEDRGQGEQEHDRADIDEAALHRLAEAREGQHAIGEEADRDSVDDRESADLGGREHAAAQARAAG